MHILRIWNASARRILIAAACREKARSFACSRGAIMMISVQLNNKAAYAMIRGFAV